MDFHHAAHVNAADPYSNVNPFSQQNHYNQLGDRNVLRHRDESLMHPGLGGTYDTRRPDYMNAVRRPDVLHHGGHPGLTLEQDPSLLSLHHATNPPALPGLDDANQVGVWVGVWVLCWLWWCWCWC